MIDFMLFNKDGRTYGRYDSNKIVGVRYEVYPSIHLYHVKFFDEKPKDRRERMGVRLADVDNFEEAREIIRVHENKLIGLFDYLDGIDEEYYYEDNT